MFVKALGRCILEMSFAKASKSQRVRLFAIGTGSVELTVFGLSGASLLAPSKARNQSGVA